jgi:hypothetical protein
LENTLQADGRGDKDEYPGEGIFTIMAIMAIMAILAFLAILALLTILLC